MNNTYTAGQVSKMIGLRDPEFSLLVRLRILPEPTVKLKEEGKRRRYDAHTVKQIKSIMTAFIAA